MKKIISIIMTLVILTTFVSAHGEIEHDDFSEALEIIENKVACDDLTDSEFELLGDYYMELMHPGDAHIRMDEMMGGEGSESLELMHINMGKRFYCDGEDYESYGMMGQNGMMENQYYNAPGYSTSRNSMMGINYYTFNAYNILYLVLLVGLIGLVYLEIFRLWKRK